MAIPSRQIGWSTKSNLLWQISKQLEALSGIMYNRGNPTTTTTTSTSTSTTTTTTTLAPVTYYYNVTGYGCGPCNVVGTFTAQSVGTPLTIGLFYNNPENTGYSFEILEEISEVVGAYDLTGVTGYATCVEACPA